MMGQEKSKAIDAENMQQINYRLNDVEVELTMPCTGTRRDREGRAQSRAG